MNRDLGGVTYYGLSAEKMIAILAGIGTTHADTFGTITIDVKSFLPPDLLEIAITTQWFPVTTTLQCLFLPVDSNFGPACQIAYRRSLSETPSTAIPVNGLLQNRTPEALYPLELANALVHVFDRKLRQFGARRTDPIPLVTVIGDCYAGNTITAALRAVSEIVCIHQELRDSSNTVLVAWYGSLTWSSPRTGMIAANFHYTTSGARRKKLFLRWHFFWKDASRQQISAVYDCSVSDNSLGNMKSLEWEIIKELIRQTSQRLCTAGATRAASHVGNQKATITTNTSFGDPDTNFGAGEDAVKTAFTRSVYWPSLQDYNEAIQNLHQSLSDEQLCTGQLHVQNHGLPYVISGAFACVYKVSCGWRDYAVRCFATPVNDQAERYRRMSTFICSDNLPYTMDFHFIEKGILLRGQWFPIVKMEWVQGKTLTAFISSNIDNKEVLNKFRRNFWLMLLELARDGVAHGDLQHGNIIIRGDEFVLVDYDGMFVPGLQGYSSREKGHPNYQHPARGEQHFGPYLDNFSAWLIDTALLAIIEDKSLWDKFDAGDESLLFRRADLVNPHQSKIFHTLAEHHCFELNRRSEYLRMLLASPVELIPPLGPGYPALVYESDNIGLPDWMH